MTKIKLIENYLLSNDLSTYDPYDIWKTNIGVKIKRLYYKNKYIGLLPAGIITIYDIYLNNNRRKNYSKQEYPISRAQAAITLLNLYEQHKNLEYLEYAKKHIDWLLDNASTGYSGHCWGMNFDWVYTATETYDKNTPFSTHTPYPLEALVQYYNITKDESVLEAIKSVFLFLEHDIQIMKETEEMLILSYGAQKDRIVTNANSYSMYMYALLINFLPEKKEYIEKKIKKLYNFILSVQQYNGSWLYAPYDDSTFIDCFHSAIVVKNLIKTGELTYLEDVDAISSKGYQYIIESFMNHQYKLCKRFSVSNKVSITKFDLYDNAEVLNLAIMQNDQENILMLSNSIKKYFINKNNEVASMVDLFGTRKNINHLRWAVIPYLNTLSKMENS
jgi:hypothetical protein